MGTKSRSKEMMFWKDMRGNTCLVYLSVCLGGGGRLTLINVLLYALSTYMITLFPNPHPAGVVLRLESRPDQGILFWQENNTREGYHLVRWKDSSQARNRGSEQSMENWMGG